MKSLVKIQIKKRNRSCVKIDMKVVQKETIPRSALKLKKTSCLLPLFSIIFLICFSVLPGLSAEITVHNNKTITIDGKTLNANCSTTTISAGSSVILNNTGVFLNIGHRKGSGSLVVNSGNIVKCFKTMQILRKQDGSPGAVLIF